MYNALIEAFRDAQERASGAYGAVMALECELLPHSDQPAVPQLPDQAVELKRYARRVVARMIQRASMQFSASGLPLAIDETSIPMQGYPNIWDAINAGVSPDLDGFWAALRSSYEGKGAAMARTQVAQHLAQALSLQQAGAIRWHSRSARFRVAAESEVVAGQGRPARRLKDEWIEPVRRVLMALATFAQEAGAAPLAGCLRQFEHGAAFQSPQRRTFPALEIAQYNDYWELRADRELAESLVDYVRRHAGVAAP